MSQESLTILLVEDNPSDAELVEEFLLDAFENLQLKNASRVSEAEKHLQGGTFDLILLDLSLPDSFGLETFEAIRRIAGATPIVVLSGQDEGEISLKAVQAGAQDYLVKTNLDSGPLGHAVQYAVERGRLEKMKNEIIATISHELKTPLTSISGSLDLLSLQLPYNMLSQTAKLLSIAQKNCERLRRMVDDIIDVEKLETLLQQAEISSIKVQDLLQETIELNESYGKQYKTGFRLGNTGDISALAVRCDYNLVVQALTNLMSNAAKYSPAGETVELYCEPNPKNIRITVKDKGPGVPDGLKDFIFERFSRERVPDNQRKEGTGLGLHITQKIIEGMGGEIGFSSVLGQGAEFWIELPADEPVSPAALEARTKNRELHHRIIYVTPDLESTYLLEHLLKSKARVQHAVDCGEARKILKSGLHVSLLLMDERQYNGETDIKELKKDISNLKTTSLLLIGAQDADEKADESVNYLSGEELLIGDVHRAALRLLLKAGPA